MAQYTMPDGNDYEFASDAEATKAMVAWKLQFEKPPKPKVEQEPAQQQSSLMDKLSGGTGLLSNPLTQFLMQAGRGARGVVEAGTNIATSIPAMAAGGLHGIGAMLTGSSPEEAARKTQETQSALTFQPRTEEGNAAAQVAALPMELASKGTGYIGGKVGGLFGNEAAGQTIGETIPPIAGTLFGGYSALKGSKALGNATAEANRTKLAELQLLKEKNAVIDAARDRVKAAGFITPAEQGPGVTITNLVKGNKILSAKNEQIASDLSAREIGLPKNTPLSEQALAERNATLNTAYDNIIKAGYKDASGNVVTGMKTPAAMKTDLSNMLGEIQQKIAYDPETFGSLQSAVPLLKEQLKRDIHDPVMAMEQIRQLRKDAKTNSMKSDDPNKMVLATTQRGLANMLEGVFEENLKDRPKLLEAFRDARKQKAQIHFVEDIYNDATGRIDLGKAVQNSDKYPLTGGLKTMVDFAKAYPEASAKVRGAVAPVTMMDALFATGAFAAGHPLIAAGELGGRIAAPALAGRGFLQSKTPSYTLSKPSSMFEAITNKPISELIRP